MYRREEILAQSSSYRRPKIFMHMPRRFRHQCQCWFWAFLVTGPTQHLALTGWALTCIGVVAGGVIGVVAALLGVAGGELLIPTIVILFGAGLKLAGRALARGEPAYHACWLYPLVGIRVFRLFVSSDASLRSWPLAQSLVVTWAGNS